MATVEGLTAVGNLEQQGVDSSTQFARQDAAKQAAEKFKSGDISGAYGILASADPGFAEKIAPHVASINPAYATQLSKAQKTGQIQALVEAQNDPATLQLLKNQGAALKGGNFKDMNLEGPNGDVKKFLIDKKDGKVKNLDGSDVDAKTLQDYAKAGFAPSVRTNANTKNPEIVSKGGKIKELTESSPILEEDSVGKAVALNPKQNDAIIKASTEFGKDKAVAALTDEINQLDKAQKANTAAIPASQALEKMRLLRGMTNRPAVQEFLQLNKGAGVAADIEDKLSTLKGQAIGPQLQQDIARIIDLYQQANLDEYNQLLHSHAAKVGANYKVDPSIVMKRTMPVMPTPIQQAIQDLEKLPPEERKVIDQAHSYILTHKRTDPDYKDALKVLRLHRL